MYDAFMLITGFIFVILSFLTAFLFAVAVWITKQSVKEHSLIMMEREENQTTYEHYKKAIEESNKVVVERFRHDLDYHAGNYLS